MSGRDNKRCSRCSSTKPLEAFGNRRDSRDGRDFYCLDCARQIGRAQYAKHRQRRLDDLRAKRQADPDRNRLIRLAARESLRAEVIARYGGACACCGESENRFLTLDHIHGIPDAHRDSAGRRMSSERVYQRVRAEGFPSDYRLLCFNCNLGRAFNGGVCPHQNRMLRVVA